MISCDVGISEYSDSGLGSPTGLKDAVHSEVTHSCHPSSQRASQKDTEFGASLNELYSQINSPESQLLRKDLSGKEFAENRSGPRIKPQLFKNIKPKVIITRLPDSLISTQTTKQHCKWNRKMILKNSDGTLVHLFLVGQQRTPGPEGDMSWSLLTLQSPFSLAFWRYN